MNVNGLIKWIKERHAIYLRRTAGDPKPWTKDVILRDYKFCNVYRELDKTTIWIAKNWRDPYVKQPDLWFAMVVARLLNRPSTLQALGMPLPWNPKAFIKLVHQRKAEGVPAFSGAYIVSTNGVAMDKAEYLAERVLTPLWKARATIRPRAGDTLESFFDRLCAHIGIGTFIAAQVVADMKYTPQFSGVEDWWTFAASGPGSRRGLNRVCGRPVDKSWSEEAWWNTLRELSCKVNSALYRSTLPPIHAQDLQNCLCEFDKYERVRLGEGRMKSTYKGGI